MPGRLIALAGVPGDVEPSGRVPVEHLREPLRGAAPEAIRGDRRGH